MSGFYEEMAGVASELLEEFNQGVVRYIEPAPTTGPSYDPQPAGDPTPYPVNATVRGVSQQYIQDGYISASDLQAMVSVFGAEPSMSGLLEIDGKEHQIIQVDAIPASGTTVAWRIFCKA